MKMEAPHQTFLADDEETLVTPRFDDEETILARRVVPLGEGVAREPNAHARTRNDPRAETRTGTRTPLTARRSWVLALAVVSALVGCVLGGAGLYLYQQRANASPAIATPAQTNATNAGSQPAPAPIAETTSDTAAVNSQTSGAQPALTETREPQPVQPSGTAETSSPNVDEKSSAATSTNSTGANAEEARVGSAKHGKKGDRDNEDAREDRRAGDSDDDARLSREDRDAPSNDGDDSVFTRPRRATRRAQARRSGGFVNRLRRIFEGQP